MINILTKLWLISNLLTSKYIDSWYVYKFSKLEVGMFFIRANR